MKSTFDENLYTTPLDKESLTRDQMARAERMAAEIEGKTSSNIHMREERNMVRRNMERAEPVGGLLGMFSGDFLCVFFVCKGS